MATRVMFSAFDGGLTVSIEEADTPNGAALNPMTGKEEPTYEVLGYSVRNKTGRDYSVSAKSAGMNVGKG